MRIEQLNLVIGLLVGVALGLLLGKPKPTNRESQTMEWRSPLRKAAGQ